MKLDFSGRIAIVTGGRVKIGYYIATKLLSYGAKVLITSRFPKDTLFKYQQDPDYEKWKNNLVIYPIDFRIFESTIKFVKFINDNFPHVDFLINNAAQTDESTPPERANNTFFFFFHIIHIFLFIIFILFILFFFLIIFL